MGEGKRRGWWDDGVGDVVRGGGGCGWGNNGFGMRFVWSGGLIEGLFCLGVGLGYGGGDLGFGLRA